MTQRPARRPQADGLHLHIISGETVRLRRFESMRILTHRYMLGTYLLLWLALVLTDPSGQVESAPYSLRMAQYATGVTTALLAIFAILCGSEFLRGGRGRPVRLPDWPVILLASTLGLAAGEFMVLFLTQEMRVSVKIFAILTVFYFVFIELSLQGIVWLLLPRILAELRRDGTAPPAQGIAVATPLLAGPVAVPPDTILHLEAQGNYVAITTDTTSHEVPGPFSALVGQMPPELGRRVHRSHWVAHRAITGHHRKGREMLLDLSSGATVPVALPRHAEVLEWLATPSSEV